MNQKQRKVKGYRHWMSCGWWHQNRSTTQVVEAAGATWSGSSLRELAGPSRQQVRESGECTPREVEHPTDWPTVLGQQSRPTAAELAQRAETAPEPIGSTTCRWSQPRGCGRRARLGLARLCRREWEGCRLRKSSRCRRSCRRPCCGACHRAFRAGNRRPRSQTSLAVATSGRRAVAAKDAKAWRLAAWGHRSCQ